MFLIIVWPIQKTSFQILTIVLIFSIAITKQLWCTGQPMLYQYSHLQKSAHIQISLIPTIGNVGSLQLLNVKLDRNLWHRVSTCHCS